MEIIGQKNARNDIIVLPGIALARNKMQFRAWQEFGQRMLGFKEILELTKIPENQSVLFSIIFQEGALHLKDLILKSEKPLGSYLAGGKFTFSAPHIEYDGNQVDEERHIIIDESKLRKAGIDLEMEKPLLVINGGYEIHNEGLSSFTITFGKSDDLKPFLCLQPIAGKDGWFGNSSLETVSNFGPVRTNEHDFPSYNFLSNLYSGGRFSVSRAVLYHDSD